MCGPGGALERPIGQTGLASGRPLVSTQRIQVMEEREPAGFVQTRLPWLIAAATLLVYLFTLNHWVSLASLPLASTITDPGARTPLTGPLQFLIFYPFRWLSPGARILALNGFSAVCAALSLALLARSVSLLPHDRTREERHRERSEFSLLSLGSAWAPPVFAVLVCGLQLTFWEHATAATGEMLDLLLFAYVTRCLLEYRLDGRERWLTRFAFVYGLAVTNNWAMIAFFPAFLVSMIWIRGRGFLEVRFIVRMLVFGLAGLSLYLLLPLLTALNASAETGFWLALRVELAAQKGAIFGMPRYMILFASLTSLLPALLIGIRWPSSFGDTSAVGNILASLMFKVLNGLFLVAGLWVAFDLPGSPRFLMAKLLQQSGEAALGIPFLTAYYLGAICLGYFAGYFLLVFSGPDERSRRRTSSATRLAGGAATALVWLVMLAAPAGLAYRNLPSLQANDGTLLQGFARTLVQSLPAENAICVSDSPQILALAQTALNQAGASTSRLLVSSTLLPYPAYQRQLHEHAPRLWPELPPRETLPPRFDSLALMLELASLATSNTVVYLQPSFGYYFEPLYLRPQGLTYRVKAYATNEVVPPSLSEPEVAQNQRFWTNLWPDLERLVPMVKRGVTDARAVAHWYSRALNYWGVQLQKLYRLPEARLCFERSRLLNPDNRIAEINLAYNESLLRQAPRRAETAKSVEDQFGPKFRSWNAILAANGPVDEPLYCFKFGQVLVQESLFRQAALQFLRVTQLEPGNLQAWLWLANDYLGGGFFDKTLAALSEAKTQQAGRTPTAEEQVALLRLEALARFGLHQTNAAEQLLLAARQQHPKDTTLLDTLLQLYVPTERWTDALKTIDHQLQTTPDNVGVLLSRAFVTMKMESYDAAAASLDAALKKEPDNLQVLLTQSALFIQTKRFTNALAALNKVLALQPDNQAGLLNRAIANLQSSRLDAAQRDYETLQAALPRLPAIFYGLGEIASQRKQIPAAIRNYESYLKYAPPDTEEAREVRNRLQRLKAGKP
jgi:tetratricopeptide (TPR) repeat protein